LSIFLAQNAQLMSAPPFILIDDPIAHVDDLNSLSFLDYLRDVALTGRRQIFFASATTNWQHCLNENSTSSGRKIFEGSISEEKPVR